VLPASLEILSWLDDNNIRVLNVAGPRESKDSTIYDVVKEVLMGLWLLSSSREQFLHSLKLSKPSKTADNSKPETVGEAVDRLMAEMKLKDLIKLAKMKEDDLVSLHYTVGMWIRNNFVYPRNEKLLESCREVSGDKYLHWAQMHMVILHELWKRLQKSHKLKVVK
jgi:hypothetical protein